MVANHSFTHCRASAARARRSESELFIRLPAEPSDYFHLSFIGLAPWPVRGDVIALVPLGTSTEHVAWTMVSTT